MSCHTAPSSPNVMGKNVLVISFGYERDGV